MTRVDRINRCLELKLVFWGPALSGKTTALRSLHGACDARRRGELASIEADGSGTCGARPCGFDFVRLDLPRFRDYDLRADCYSVPGFVGFEATRRRLLRGADGVLFMADLSPAGIDANVESWQALDRLLRGVEANDRQPVPVVALANKADVADAHDVPGLQSRLFGSCGRRPLGDLAPSVAARGEGVVAAFRVLASAAAARALEPLEALHLTGGGFPQAPCPEDESRDRRFADSFCAQFGGGEHGAVVDPGAAVRTLSVAHEARDPDAQPVPEPRAEAARWQGTRELEVRERRREAALGRLLVDVAHACAAATDTEGAARSVLVQLVMNLDAVSGWVGLADTRTDEVVYDPMGRSRDALAVAEAAQALSEGLGDDHLVSVGEAATAGFPGGAAGGRGVFLQFPVSGSEPGWLLLVGPPGRGLPPDAEPTLHTAAAILGLTVARLNALEQLRSLNRALEQKVAERTAQLRDEKVTLEARVRERTRELEKAKRAALETERRLFDRGRREGVHQVAAGLAHELNNPLSAVAVNLRFALELLEGAPADSALPPAWLEEVREAVRDAANEAEVVADRVATVPQRDVAASRRAAARTVVYDAVAEAAAHFETIFPTSPAPRLAGPRHVAAGIQRAELTRWLFRLLSGLATSAEATTSVRIVARADGPRVDIRVDGPAGTGAAEMLAAIAEEVEGAGGRLDAEQGTSRCRVGLALPAPMGQRDADAIWERSA